MYALGSDSIKFQEHLAFHGTGTSVLDPTPAREMQTSRIHLAAAGRRWAGLLPEHRMHGISYSSVNTWPAISSEKSTCRCS